MKSLRYIVCLLALVAVGLVSAQNIKPTITSHLSADSVMIGDRFTLTIEVEKDVMQQIAFPTFDFQPSDGSQGAKAPSVEVIHDFAPDTVKGEGRRIRLRKRYEMAIFDEGIYNLGKAKALYADKNLLDTLIAEREEQIVVLTFQIDSTSHTIFDLKPQKTLKFRFGEIAGYLGILLATLLLLAGLVWLVVWALHRRGKRLRDIFKTPPPPPPHVVAIEALERLHNEKLWQNNKHKEYYSGLSDILRTYLAGQFELGAMEMTTDEIVEALKGHDMAQKAKMDLVAVLRDADLVKFAKAQFEAEDNELAYSKSYHFVEETKPVEVVEEAEDEPTKNEKR